VGLKNYQNPREFTIIFSQYSAKCLILERYLLLNGSRNFRPSEVNCTRQMPTSIWAPRNWNWKAECEPSRRVALRQNQRQRTPCRMQTVITFSWGWGSGFSRVLDISWPACDWSLWLPAWDGWMTLCPIYMVYIYAISYSIKAETLVLHRHFQCIFNADAKRAKQNTTSIRHVALAQHQMPCHPHF